MHICIIYVPVLLVHCIILIASSTSYYYYQRRVRLHTTTKLSSSKIIACLKNTTPSRVNYESSVLL